MRTNIALTVLTCLVGVYVVGIRGQDPCCKRDCNCSPPPINVTIEEILKTPKYFVKIVPAIPVYAGVDNLCYTFFPLPGGNYLVNIATVYSNGFNTTVSYTITDTKPGVFPIGYAKCTQEATIFDFLDNKFCNGMYLTSVATVYGECPFSPGNDMPIVVFSTDSRPVSRECLSNVTAAISRNGVESQDYITLPMKLKDACATKLKCTI